MHTTDWQYLINTIAAQVRKLEFLMAEALANGHDCVITIGGIQSNHCRATAAAATYLGMDCHLILRNTEHHARQDAGLVGNLLPERLQGAHVHQVTAFCPAFIAMLQDCPEPCILSIPDGFTRPLSALCVLHSTPSGRRREHVCMQ